MPDLELNAATTAVVLIDLQQGIIARQVAPHSAADVILRAANLADRFRQAGSPIVFVRVDLANIIRPTADVPLSAPSAPPPPPSASELVAELRRLPTDLVVTKRFWDAFINTDLERHLRERNIRTIVLGGISTNIGVESTARTAAALGFDVVLVEDVTSSMSEEAHRFSIANIYPRLGRVRTANELQVRP
ncbi:MAG TPA: isochorismatase family protein [Lacipirellulaceae bacterium]|jgi:nicotinamidase-related amidase|nr:isochorismatase family protein [Lacipirellulaceae bacterium]